MKKAIIIVGSLGVATIIGVVLYNKYKNPVMVPSGNTSGSAAPPNKTTEVIDKVNQGIDTGKQVVDAVNSFMTESFPIRLGMKGPNTKLMQTALRDKFNQLNISLGGLYDLKTLNALKATGYATLLNNGVSEQDFKNILAGIKKA